VIGACQGAFRVAGPGDFCGAELNAGTRISRNLDATVHQTSMLPMNDSDINSSKRRQMTPTDRLKSGQACTSCRKGKNRCDGLRPTCTYCLRRNLECDYVPAAKRPKLSARYVICVDLSLILAMLLR
jgi:hypothetical protein